MFLVSGLAAGLPMTPNILQETNPGALGPAATITFTTVGTITQQGSGKMLVMGKICPQSNAGNDILSYSLLRDGSVTLPPLGENSQSGANHHEMGTLMWIDTAPDGNPHKYSIQCASGAGTLTDDIGHAVIVVVEITQAG